MKSSLSTKVALGAIGRNAVTVENTPNGWGRIIIMLATSEHGDCVGYDKVRETT